MWLWDWIRDALYSIADFWEDFGDDLGKIPLIGETLESWCDYVADWWNYLGDRADDMSAIMDDVMRTTLDFPDWETIRDRIEDTWAWLTWSASDFVNWIKSALERSSPPKAPGMAGKRTLTPHIQRKLDHKNRNDNNIC